MSITVDENIFPDIRHVTFRKCTPSWEMPEQELPICNMTYVIQGRARYTINGKVVELKEGNLLVLPKNCVRKGITFPDDLMHCYSIDFYLKNFSKTESQPPFPLVSEPGCQLGIIHLFQELALSWVTKRPGYIIKCNSLFLQIFHIFLEIIVYQDKMFTGDFRITKAIRYLEMHYAKKVTIKEISKMVGLNPTYFGVLFNKTVGINFHHFLLQTRIRNAENMLYSGEFKVNEVSDACGFSDVSHFYKQFKKEKGFPPSHSLLKKF